MDDSGILGKALGQLGTIAKKTGEEIIKKPEEMAGDVASEFGLKTDIAPQSPKPTSSDEQATKEVVKSLYAPSEKPKDTSQSPKPDDSEFAKQIANETPEEQQKLITLRQQLHKEYYEKLVNPPKPQEERPAEKVEKEKKQEMAELQKKEEKKPSPLIQRARERVEKFPGASG
ncbi:MAG: hypothetical protein Q7R31_00275 [Candidatus Levybacteria bacterium]|nr:hypothetical protein [Candidatus Levybacteria bacterium]